MKIINGKEIANKILDRLEPDILELRKKGIIPTLAVILVGDDQSSEIYVKNKRKIFEEMGLGFKLFAFEKFDQEKVADLINKLNDDPKIQGILVQSPIPGTGDQKAILSLVDSSKDVDCLNPKNISEMHSPVLKAILRVVREMKIDIKKSKIVIVGKGELIGKPFSKILKEKKAKFQVVDKDTKNKKQILGEADLVISAVGQPGVLKIVDLKNGVSLIDAGGGIKAGKTVGDFIWQGQNIFREVSKVPGGIGPITIAFLVENLLILAKQQVSEKRL